MSTLLCTEYYLVSHPISVSGCFCRTPSHLRIAFSQLAEISSIVTSHNSRSAGREDDDGSSYDGGCVIVLSCARRRHASYAPKLPFRAIYSILTTPYSVHTYEHTHHVRRPEAEEAQPPDHWWPHLEVQPTALRTPCVDSHTHITRYTPYPVCPCLWTPAKQCDSGRASPHGQFVTMQPYWTQIP